MPGPVDRYYVERCRPSKKSSKDSAYFTSLDPYCYKKDIRELEDIIHGRMLDSMLQRSDMFKVDIYEKDIAVAHERARKLANYRWGLGLEHEMHLFHINPLGQTGDMVLFNTEPYVQRIMNRHYESKLADSQKLFQFLQKIPFETSGRRCSNLDVVPDIGVKMPEFISGHPFSTIDENFLGIENYVSELMVRESLFKELLMKEPDIRRLVRTYGPLNNFPVGYCNAIRIPVGTDESDGKYMRFRPGLMEDYTGSFHITLTLPHDPNKTSNDKFISIHQNFCNMLQWIEPLLLTAFFTGDPAAVGTTRPYVRGSARVGKIGWGNFAGSDVRRFAKGIGRYSVIPTYWRNGLEFEGVAQLRPCIPPSPPAIRENAISALSSDFRTFGSTDPLRPWHRESGAPMMKPNGIEIRIFDQFRTDDLVKLVHIIIYIAALSQTHKAAKYVYNNVHWNNAMQTIMMRGWLAPIDEEYVRELRGVLGLPITTRQRVAYFFFRDLVEEIFFRVRDDDWIFMMMRQRNILILPEINRLGWEISMILYLQRTPRLRRKFEQMLKDIIYHWPIDRKISREVFEHMILKHMPPSTWEQHVDDIAYMLRGIGWIEIERNDIGNVENLIILKRKVKRDRLTVRFIRKYLLTSENKRIDMTRPLPGVIIAPSFRQHLQQTAATAATTAATTKSHKSRKSRKSSNHL